MENATSSPQEQGRQTTKILKSDDFAALDRARQGVDAAREEADGIVQAAYQERERILAEARERAQKEAAALVGEFLARMQQDLAQREASVVDIVMQSVRKLIEPSPEPAIVTALVRRALQDVDSGSDARLTVAPQLVHAVREYLERAGIGPGILIVQGNPDCPEGASTLHCAFGDIELGVEEQLKALENGLRASLGTHKE